MLGFVINLHRPEGQEDGDVIIKGLLDGRPRSLSAHLPGRLYQLDQLAIAAHDAQAPISVLGDIEMQGGRRWRLLEPREFQLVNDQDGEIDGPLPLD